MSFGFGLSVLHYGSHTHQSGGAFLASSRSFQAGTSPRALQARPGGRPTWKAPQCADASMARRPARQARGDGGMGLGQSAAGYLRQSPPRGHPAGPAVPLGEGCRAGGKERAAGRQDGSTPARRTRGRPQEGAAARAYALHSERQCQGQADPGVGDEGPGTGKEREDAHTRAVGVARASRQSRSWKARRAGSVATRWGCGRGVPDVPRVGQTSRAPSPLLCRPKRRPE